MPGTFFIVLINLLYQLIDAVEGINWRLVFWLFLISIILELAEFVITAWSSKCYGASKPGTIGAIIGSFAGAMTGSGFIPLLGTLLGAFFGAFIGAFLVDLLRTGDAVKSFRAGFGAFTGSVGGKLIKLVGEVGMLVIIAR